MRCVAQYAPALLVPAGLIHEGKRSRQPECQDDQGKEAQGQEHASIAEHQASHGERRTSAAWHGTTGAGEMAEHDSDNAAGNAGGIEPYEKETRDIDTEEEDTDEEETEDTKDETGDSGGWKPRCRSRRDLGSTRRGSA